MTLDDHKLTLKERLLITASWMEAEGSFCQWGKCNVAVTSNQVEKAPLLLLQKWWGGSLYRFQPKNKNANPQWNWKLGGRHAVALAFTLYPLMMTKKRQGQICKMMVKWRMRKAQTQCRTTCPKGHPFSVTYRYQRGRGRVVHRVCRICVQVSQRKWNVKQRLRTRRSVGQTALSY
jgi:hypothetical protein